MPTADTARLWVLDTHIWVRLLGQDSELSRPSFLRGLADAQKTQGLRLAAITLWETAMLVSKERLKLEKPVLEWTPAALTLPGLEVVLLGPKAGSRRSTRERSGRGSHRQGDSSQSLLQLCDGIGLGKQAHLRHRRGESQHRRVLLTRR